jgi:uncharacterized protein (DUF924 family)
MPAMSTDAVPPAAAPAAGEPLPGAREVVAFWRDAGPSRWFTSDAAFDAELRARFAGAHLAAARRELDGWADDADGLLALLILLDQFPRNAFRGTAHMYATDALARRFARQAVTSGLHLQVDEALRLFVYLPFNHSEDLADQEQGLALTRTLGKELSWHAEQHRDIVRRFGRFPHRNPLLGRDTTAEEQAFLDGGGFKG